MDIHPTGGYAYDQGLRFASNGVRAEPGFSIERASWASPADFASGLERIHAHLEARERPMEALCGLELRMPASLPLDEFVQFNNDYLARLDDWRLLRDGVPPLARTNVCPRDHESQAPGVVAFSYTVAAAPTGPWATPGFVMSGVPELPAGGRYPDDILRRGETSRPALHEKATSIIAEVVHRIGQLGCVWDAAAQVHLYSLHDLTAFVQRRALASAGIRPVHGVTSHDAAPPTAELELEIDVRRYTAEHALDSPG